MLCEKCGAQLDSDSKFCLNCGAPAIPQETPPAATGFFSNKKNVMLVGIIAAVLVVGIIAAIILAGLPTTIYVDHLLTIEYSGLSTQGTAEIGMDTDALTARLKEELSEEEMYLLMVRIAQSGYRLKLDKTDGLTNGDEIHIDFFMDNEIAKEYGIQFKLKKSTVKVTELQEPVFLDLFKDLKLVYTGCSPYAQVEIENNSAVEFVKSEVSFSIHNNSDLEEGEAFTVEASFSEPDANEAGYIILETTHTYTASNLPQPEELNPLDHIEIIFSGLQEAGRVQYKVQDADISFLHYIDFTFDKYQNLSEGEVITLSYSVQDDQDPLKHGYTLAAETSRQITVPTLGTYVTNFTQLSAAGQQQIIDKATEVAKLYLTRESADNKTDSIHLTGTGFKRGNQLSLAAELGNVKLHSVVACQSSPLAYHTKYLYFFFTVDITSHPNIKTNDGSTTGAMYLRIASPIVRSDGTLETELDGSSVFSTNDFVYLSTEALDTALEGKLHQVESFTPEA